MYQVGVLKGLYENTPEEYMDYDVFTGVSAGSINACTLAMFDKGETKEALVKLEAFTRTTVPEQGY